MITAPTLETSRIRLRLHRQSDFEAYANLFASERAQYMGQLKRRHAWYSFASEVGHWALMGFGPWAIELKANSQYIGQIAITHHDHFPEPELGWVLFDGNEGQGLAFEAAVTARNWAVETKAISSLVSYIDPENSRSIALAERLGAWPDEFATADDETDLVYRHRLELITL